MIKMSKIIIVVSIIIVSGLILYFWLIPKKKNTKELELTYKINAGIPFKWEYEIEDSRVVSFVKSYVIKNENKGGIVGAPVYTNYVFKGLKAGETTIIFKFVNMNGIVSKEEKHLVKVDKDGNIMVINRN